MLHRTAALLLAALAFAPFGGALAQDAPPPDVVATVKPLHSLTSALMQGVGAPHLLVRGSASPHAFSLKPSDAAAIAEAELIVRVGPVLETFLEKPLRSLGGEARILDLIAAPGVRTVENRAGGVWTGEEAHAHGAEGSPDGHIWLDPGNAKAMAEAIAAALIEVDPAREAVYRKNLAALSARIDALDAELAGKLTPVKDRPFIVFHDAYHYLEDRYGLNAAGAITVSPDQRPGARRLRELRDRIQALGAVCVFAEPQFEPALVATLAEGTGAETGILDPEGAAIADGPDLYFTLMRANAKALSDCLSAD